MSFYLGEETNIDPSEKKTIVTTYYSAITHDQKIIKTETTRGNADELLDNFISRQLLMNGLRMIIFIAQHRNEDYRDYDCHRNSLVDPKLCEELDYEYNSKYITITTPYGDYATVRWHKLEQKPPVVEPIDPNRPTNPPTYLNLTKRSKEKRHEKQK